MMLCGGGGGISLSGLVTQFYPQAIYHQTQFMYYCPKILVLHYKNSILHLYIISSRDAWASNNACSFILCNINSGFEGLGMIKAVIRVHTFIHEY